MTKAIENKLAIDKMTKANCISELTNASKAFNKKDTVAELRARVTALRKDLESSSTPENSEAAPVEADLIVKNDPACSVFGEQDKGHKDCQACIKAFSERADACSQVTALRASTKTGNSRRSGGSKKSSESKVLIQEMLTEGVHTRAAIIKAYLDKYPNNAKSTVMTYLSDSKNVKYSAFRDASGKQLLTEEDKNTKAMRFIA